MAASGKHPARGEEGVRAVAVREGAEESALRLPDELRMIALESEGDLLVLLRSNRAGSVDDATAGSSERQDGVENFALETGQVGDVANAEARVGTAAEDAEPGAGRVDENDVGAQVRRWTLRDLDPGSRSPGALAEPPQPLAVRVAGDEAALVAEIGGERERLPARAGAGIEDDVTGSRRAERRDELAPFVLHFEETFAEGSEREQVRPRGGDEEPVRGALRLDR